MKPILFPNLGLEFNINPVAFTAFDKDIYWYGIIIMSGIILALFLMWRRTKNMSDVDKATSKITWNNITDMVLFMLPVGVICARLYFCIFKWDYYGSHLEDIFKIWNGGLAIYGGIIGGFVTGVIYCKVKKIQVFEMADFCIPYLALCQSIGRWGNFVNQEAFGAETDSFFKMGLFNNELGKYVYYHPAFLYESICTLLIFIILLIVSKRKKFSGQIMFLYFMLYGIARFFIEGLRMDSLYVGNTGIRVSQLLSIILFVVFLIAYIFKRANIRAKLIKILRDNKEEKKD